MASKIKKFISLIFLNLARHVLHLYLLKKLVSSKLSLPVERDFWQIEELQRGQRGIFILRGSVLRGVVFWI